MSPRRKWDSPNPSLASECAPSPRTGGGAHSPAGEGLGESQFLRLEKKLSTLLLCELLYTVAPPFKSLLLEQFQNRINHGYDFPHLRAFSRIRTLLPCQRLFAVPYRIVLFLSSVRHGTHPADNYMYSGRYQAKQHFFSSLTDEQSYSPQSLVYPYQPCTTGRASLFTVNTFSVVDPDLVKFRSLWTVTSGVRSELGSKPFYTKTVYILFNSKLKSCQTVLDYVHSSFKKATVCPPSG